MDHALTLPRSRVECLGPDRSRCGYCKSLYTSVNFGAWAHALDVRDYQALLDAGWRRSGSYLYRPDLVTTCCPSFVIRLDASQFKPSSSHKRVLKRIRRIACSENALSPSSSSVSASSGVRVSGPPQMPATVATDSQAPPRSNALLEQRESISNSISSAIDSIFRIPRDAALFPPQHIVDPMRSAIKVFPPRNASSSKKRKKTTEVRGTQALHSPTVVSAPQLISNVALLLASAERKAKIVSDTSDADKLRARARRKQRDDDNEHVRLRKKVETRRQMEIANLLADHLRNLMPELQTVVVTEPGFLNFGVEDLSNNEHDDDMMHEGVSATKCMELDSVNRRSLSARLRSEMKDSESRIRVSLRAKSIPLSRIGSDASSDKTISPQDVPSQIARESSQVSEGSSEAKEGSVSRGEAILEELSEGKTFTMELVPAEYRAEAYEIFRKYQMAVHQERPHQCSEDAYKRFLVDSPLIESRSSVDPEQRYGSYHMQYRLSGKLFAVGVVDVLPRCLSSVYLFYDPDFAKLSPGTLSAVKEIEWVKRASVLFPSLQFYYMGYYIHSCAKMRYKAAFYPSEILCEETKNWIPVCDAQRRLDVSTNRVIRLAPESMSIGRDGENFRIDEQDMSELTKDTWFVITFEGGGVRLLTYEELSEILLPGHQEQREALQRKIRTFARLVGKEGCKNYLHVL